MVRTTIFHTKLFCGQWRFADTLVISLNGLTMDTVWENLITEIGVISIEEGNTLDEQIVINDSREKILVKIRMLEAKTRKEKQPRKKIEYFNAIKKLKNQTEWKK